MFFRPKSQCYFESLSRADQFLLTCCSPARLPHVAELVPNQLNQLQWNRVYDRVEHFPFAGGKAPFWLRANYDVNFAAQLPAEFSDRCRAGEHWVANRYRRRIAALLELLDLLHRSGIDCTVMKGAGLILGGYHRPEDRFFGDVDLLVNRSLVEAAERVMQDSGWYAQPDAVANRQRYLAKHYHLPPLFRDLENGLRLCVELQWQASGTVAGPQFTKDLLDTRQKVNCQGRSVWVAAGEWMFVHTVLDTMSHTFCKGLAPLCDLRALAHHDRRPLNWPKVLRLIHGHRVQIEASLMLKLLNDFFGAAPAPLTSSLNLGTSSESLCRAMRQLVMWEPTDRVYFWRLLALALQRSSLPAISLGEEDINEQVVSAPQASLLRRSIGQVFRIAYSMPQFRKILRREQAEVVVREWLVHRSSIS